MVAIWIFLLEVDGRQLKDPPIQDLDGPKSSLILIMTDNLYL